MYSHPVRKHGISGYYNEIPRSSRGMTITQVVYMLFGTTIVVNYEYLQLPDEYVMKYGFTLIEMSIVLVVIGLIAGGVLVGQDLINVASVRAQISQIEKYQTAVHTFQGKYGYLPGDIPDPIASQFGFQPRGHGQGAGNGDGLVVGSYCNGGNSCAGGNLESAGEAVMFWVDLSTAGLIDGGFNTATSYTPPGADITGAAISNYLPVAKIGNANYMYVWAGGTYTAQWNYSGINYFGLSLVQSIAAQSNFGKFNLGAKGLSVNQAYNIDKKMDDGYPQTGSVIAVYIKGDPDWTDGTDTLYSSPSTAATAGSSTTCYDNNNTNSATQRYSVSQNGGNGINCALSFKFQ